jgi:hypothetical protein
MILFKRLCILLSLLVVASARPQDMDEPIVWSSNGTLSSENDLAGSSFVANTSSTDTPISSFNSTSETPISANNSATEETPISSVNSTSETPISADDRMPETPISSADNSTAQDLKTYIVIFNESYPVNEHMSDNATQAMVEKLGGTVIFRYHLLLNGMAVSLPSHAAVLLDQDERVEKCFEDVNYSLPIPPKNDQIILDSAATSSAASSFTNGIPYFFDRLDQTNLPLDGTYTRDRDQTAGAGVNVCVS